MWIQALGAAEPRRLVLRDGTWTLELEELVRCFGAVYRPVRHELRGRRPILEMLNHSQGGRRLHDGAAELIDADPSRPMMRFDVLDGTWREEPSADDVRVLEVPGRFARRARFDALGLRAAWERSRRLVVAEHRALRGESRSEASPAPAPGPALAEHSAEATPVEVAAEEDAALVADEPRIKPLSATPDSEPPAPRRRASIPLASAGDDASADEPPVAPEDDPSALLAAMAEEEAQEDAQEGELAGDGTHTDAVLSEEDASPQESAEPEAPPPLRFPAAAALGDNLIMLLGEEPVMTEVRGEEVALDGDALAGAYALPLEDEGGREVGLWLIDAFAAQALGAGLRGLSAEDRAALRGVELADPELLDATSEVLSTLVSTLAAVDGNPTVHAGALAPYQPGPHPWVAAARERLSLELEGFGRIWGLGA